MKKDALQAIGTKKEDAVKEAVLHLTDEHKKALRFLIDEKKKAAILAEQNKEDIKALAERLGTKPGKVNKLISFIMKEEDTGGAVQETSSVLTWVEQFLDVPATV
jgi:hypothetical protein